MTTNWSEENYDDSPRGRNAERAVRVQPTSHVPMTVPQRDHSSPGRFVSGGLPVRCPHCHAEEFIEGAALLSTVGISFAHLNWTTEKKVTNLMCDNCGLIQWFGAIPQRR